MGQHLLQKSAQPTDLGGLDDLLEEVLRVLVMFRPHGGQFFLSDMEDRTEDGTAVPGGMLATRQGLTGI